MLLVIRAMGGPELSHHELKWEIQMNIAVDARAMLVRFVQGVEIS